MASIYDVDANELIEKAAIELKKTEHIKPPVWADYVKTGVSKERAPANKDWWYIRAAAILRTIYRMGPIGVSKIRTRYGSKKARGFKPKHFYSASGNIIRKILQQLEKAGFLKKEEKSLRKGRLITPAGKSFLDKIATQMYKGAKKDIETEERKIEVKKEEKPKTEKNKEEKKPQAKPEVKKEVPKKAEEKTGAKK
ncbi:MAG: 30S ribosomal protein S19e [Nanoarchaeota archaeon]|nr:30S ribosomal protein S19e [Nanoarchaeota archaeon]